MSFCGKCGQELSDGAKFCKKCGSDLLNNEELPSAGLIQADLNPGAAPVVVQTPEKKRNVIILSLLVLLLLAGGFWAWKMFTGQAENALFPIPVGEKWGYIDNTGKVVIQPQYDEVHFFSEGLAAVRMGDNWGFINDKGIMVIPPRFTEIASEFSEGLASVNMGEESGMRGQWGYIDKTGNLVFQTEYPGLSFHDSKALVTDNFNYGLIDRTGSKVTDLIYGNDMAKNDVSGSPFSSRDIGFTEGLCPVDTGDGWGYIDKNLKMVIEPRFSFAGSFSEDLALVLVIDDSDESFEFIDKNGQMVLKFPGDYEPFSPISSEGLMVVRKDDKFGFMDTRGNIAIEPKYNNADSFHDGLAAVYINEKWQFINKTGQMVVQLSEGWAPINRLGFSNGLCGLTNYKSDETKMKYIDKTGRVVWSSDGSSNP